MREKENSAHAGRTEKGVIRGSQNRKEKPEKLPRTELCPRCQVWGAQSHRVTRFWQSGVTLEDPEGSQGESWR